MFNFPLHKADSTEREENAISYELKQPLQWRTLLKLRNSITQEWKNVAERECTWWELGMALLEWHGTVSRGAQTQDHRVIPLRLGLHWLPEKKGQLPFYLLILTVLFLFVLDPLHCSPLGFLTLWHQFIVSLACWGWKSLTWFSPAHTWVMTHS